MKSSELIGKKVVIAPFSTDAIFLYHQLRRDGAEVVAFMDKDVSLHKSSYLGTMIIPYFHFEGKDIAAVIAKPGYIQNNSVIYNELIAVNYQQNEIIQQEDIEFECSVKDISDNIDFGGLAGFRNLDWMHLLKEKMYSYASDDGLRANIIDLVVTTRCSLKCSGCGTLMDFFRPEEQRDYNLEKTIQSFDRLMQYFDFVHEVIPIGGEPFLYKDLDKLLLHIADGDTRKIGMVALLTNGTVLPSPSVLEIISARPDLFNVQISDYGRSSSKKFELVSLLNKHKCSYKNMVRDTWYSIYQPIVPPADMTEKEIRAKCTDCNCYHGGQLRVVENRIYTCVFLAFGTECHVIPDDRRNYLDLEHDILSKEVLRKFMTNIFPGAAYCGAQRSFQKERKFNKLIPVAQQVTEPRECVRYE